MSNLRVSAVQMGISASLDNNLKRILDFIIHCESDFVLFPEMALTSLHGDLKCKGLKTAWDQIAAACRQSYTTAIVGTGCREDNINYIQSRIFTDEGNLLGTHEKLVPTLDEHEYFRPGEELRTFEHMGLVFGCLIGNDMWVAPGFGPYPDPRLSCQLGKKGAQVIFHSINSGSDKLYRSYYESNLKLRAIESKVYIVTANAASDNGILNVPTGIISPEGEWLVRCLRQDEQTFIYDLDIETG